jgi:hypothetical protein
MKRFLKTRMLKNPAVSCQTIRRAQAHLQEGSMPTFARSVIIVSLCALSFTAYAQMPPAPLDDAARSTVIAQIVDALHNVYIFPDSGEKAAARLQSQLASGAYRDFATPRALADKLTSDLYEVTKDKHMFVTAPGQPLPPLVPVGAGGGPAPTGPAPESQSRSEAGVVRADKLAGDIGYVEVTSFPQLGVFKAAIERAMAPLAGSKAIILDLRRNQGGSPDGESYLVSFFCDPSKTVALNSIVSRQPNTREFSTQAFTAAKTTTSMFGKPLYVLISSRTFSAGEAVAYDLQALKLATLVGDTTGGGANLGRAIPIAQFSLFMPFGRAENPITHTNWEGGVKPDIPVPGADALKVALEKLGQKPSSGDIAALSLAQVFAPRTTAQPASEAAIRRTVDELARNQPNYEMMSPGMQQLTRAQLPGLNKLITDMGELKSLRFLAVGSGGMDSYEVVFANGTIMWSIALDEHGRTISAGIQRRPN